jgi:7,8-dihydroneopterin aldolase/epimerase/oxygenase
LELTTVKINNAKFFSYHGMFQYEKEFGNQFEVDIEMQCDLSELKQTDSIKHTVNYLEVYNFVKNFVHEHQFNLIETLNQEICRGILDTFYLVKKVKVSIRKPNAPLGVIDSVEIINEMEK